MSSDIAISIKNLTKTYRLFDHPGDRIKQALTFGSMKFHREFTALKDLSFEVRKGETVGIIGRNGSGKSTLLQLICGILKPTSGSVTVNGRISALLELGSGFNPEFTGRENIYFQGAIMGFSKAEMDAKVGDIIAFADIGEFIDQPVRTYSSGMFVRLAFAVAIHSDPDILLVDEALAVGDLAFQGRCLKKISEIRHNGGSVLLVTHAMEQVAHFCDRAVLLEKGRLTLEGNSADTLNFYLGSLNPQAEVDRARSSLEQYSFYNPKETRWGDGAAVIVDCKIIQDERVDPVSLLPGIFTEIRLHVIFYGNVHSPIYGLTLKSRDGAIIFTTNSQELLLANEPPKKQGDEVFVSFSFRPFLDSGEYFVSVGIVSSIGGRVVPHDRRYDVIKLNIAPHSAGAEPVANPAFRILSSL